LEAAICNLSVIGISDGSFMLHQYPALASVAWLITSASASPLSNFLGVCMVSGPPSLIYAYQAKLQGIHMLLVALKHFCSYHHITSEGVTIGCDSQGALSQAQQFHEHVPCALVHTNLIQAIMALRLWAWITLTFVYVPSHQDALTQVEHLIPLAQLNVWADAMAKKELHHIATCPQCPSLPALLLLGEQWYAQVLSGKITSDPHSMVVNLLGQREALRYWSHKQQLDVHSFDMVHWELIDKATQSFPPMLTMWLSKFASGHSAVVVTMLHWKWWNTPICPLCQAMDEITEHILGCSHAFSRETLESADHSAPILAYSI